MHDDELMTRVAAGEEAAFRLLVERWERPVQAFLWRMTGSREEAEDLTQDTFVKIHANASGYRPEGRFQSWLFRISGNLARSWARRRRIVGWIRYDPDLHERPSATPGPDELVSEDETGRRVREALARLPARQRQALVLRKYHGMSQQEIAATMATTEGAVESLLIRALEGLRKTLVPGMGDDR
ncbi:sigma-70 family RNA polymerase sigma factor [bacterium]|nr:sigma-70 family RNA polymerase sigma factor [bacterium]MBU1073441.1 sigma-70 family RNA polymerase sigma factor [bacterium]MBU1676239.1 sigma-70 family RNA polymerase sigma factor [bacterium]